MKTFLALLATLADFAKVLFMALREKAVRQGGVDAQVAVQQESTIDDARDVKDAQNAAAAQLERQPDSVMQDDGFRRD